jgi:hypothetical protein
MVKILTIVLFLFISINSSYSKVGVITVLEAPVFSAPNIKAKVLQYHRKGESVYVHPAEFSRDMYEDLFEEDPETIKKFETKYQNEFKDKLFDVGVTYFPNPKSKFVKTLTRSAKEGYILKEHIFLLYKDERELSQKVVKVDPTDYRIEEHLPENYPLLNETGYRGQASFGLGTPMGQSYPYAENINDTGYNFNKEFTFVGSRQVQFDQTRRFFFGGMFNILSSSSSYLTNNIEAEETELRLGVGPYLSYDVWKTDSLILNLNTALILNIYNTKSIKQDLTEIDISETKDYKSTYFSPRFGTTLAIRNVLSKFDFISGANITLNLPHTYTATDGSGTAGFWQDSFSVGYFVEQTFFIGMQTDY